GADFTAAAGAGLALVVAGAATAADVADDLGSAFFTGAGRTANGFAEAAAEAVFAATGGLEADLLAPVDAACFVAAADEPPWWAGDDFFATVAEALRALCSWTQRRRHSSRQLAPVVFFGPFCFACTVS